MLIHLKHPIHGCKATTNAVEAKHDREHGWEEYTPTETVLPSFLSSVKPAESDIPAGFPGRQVLIDGGVTTWAVLVGKSYQDLSTIPGITPEVAFEIIKALE